MEINGHQEKIPRKGKTGKHNSPKPHLVFSKQAKKLEKKVLKKMANQVLDKPVTPPSMFQMDMEEIKKCMEEFMEKRLPAWTFTRDKEPLYHGMIYFLSKETEERLGLFILRERIVLLKETTLSLDKILCWISLPEEPEEWLNG